MFDENTDNLEDRVVSLEAKIKDLELTIYLLRESLQRLEESTRSAILYNTRIG